MDATMEQKQQYLRVNILEAGYDAEDFIEFLHQHTSDDSPDMNDLTLEEIQTIVQKYRKQKSPDYSFSTHPEQQFASPTEEDITAEKLAYRKMIFSPERVKVLEEKKTKIEYPKYAPLFDYELKGAIKCIETEKLAKVNAIEVAIPDMETKEIEGFIFGFGSKTEYYYHIQSNLMKGPVKRLSEDFDWFNVTLQRLYPTMIFPELEPLRKDVKEPYIHRKAHLEEYMQHLACRDYMMYSQLFVDFLTLSSDKMEKYKKSYESMGFAKGVFLIKNAEGVANIELSNNTRDFYNNSKVFSKKTSHLHEQISLALSKMTESIRVAVVDTYAVVDLFAELYDSYTELTNKFPLLRKEDYSDTLVSLNNLFLGLGDNFKRTADLLDSHLKQYYRFSAGFDRGLFKLQKLVKDSENEYLDFKYNLARKKQRVISDPNKWEMDSRDVDVKKLSREELLQMILPKDALTESEHKSWYAYNLKNYQCEFQQYIDFVARRYQQVFRSYAKDLLASDKNYLEALTKFLSDIRKKQNA